jgi:hypothetical protein
MDETRLPQHAVNVSTLTLSTKNLTHSLSQLTLTEAETATKMKRLMLKEMKEESERAIATWKWRWYRKTMRLPAPERTV